MLSINDLPIGTLVKINKSREDRHHKYIALLPSGEEITSLFESYQLRKAFKSGAALKLTKNASGDNEWRVASVSEFNELVRVRSTNLESDASDDRTIWSMLSTAGSLRPRTYKMDDLKWRFAVRTILRGKNAMIIGPKGCGKTTLAFALAEVLRRPLFNIPLGSTQDPRSTLIGNTHFKVSDGTYVVCAEFVRAIQTPNAIILLDELSRAHPDAWNILMSVLDYKQRFLRIDEDPHTPVIKVAPGVSFIATANAGTTYTSTRTLDEALVDRFIAIEVNPLERMVELELLQDRVPGVSQELLQAITSIAADIRKEARSDDAKLTNIISTRSTIEMAELLHDQFTFQEAAELVIYSQFTDIGGTNSERTFVKQIVQRYIPTNGTKTSPFELDESPKLGSDDDSKAPWM